MKSDAAANAGGATRSLLTWILVLLVLANIVVWTAWPFRGELVARGILAPPPAERVDFEPLMLPPIVERVAPFVTDQTDESTVNSLSESERNGAAELGMPPDGQPLTASPISPAIAGETFANGQPTPPGLLDCVVVGPVGSRQALEAVATRLRTTGARVDSLKVSDVDYNVYIKPADSLGAAQLVLRELDAQSIEDVDIIWSGAYENAVTVGVYGSRNRADARRDRIAALGYDVLVRKRHYLRARQVAADALGDLGNEPCPDDEAG